MKETGIIMSGNHPKLILDGLKTMTRRTYGLEKVNLEPDAWEFKRINDGGIALFWRKNIMEGDTALCKCPYGQVGDRLWVRETFMHRSIPDIAFPESPKSILYKATNPEVGEAFKWKPSIHMPRWASRITLEITEVRVERLQEITEDDAMAEGICVVDNTMDSMYSPPNYPDIHRDIFMELWDSINAKRGYGWDTNPWVWVISFKRIDNVK